MSCFNRFTFLLPAILFAVTVLAVSSCGVSVDKPDVTYSYIYNKNAKIKVKTTHKKSGSGNKTILRFSVVQGNSLVFVNKKFNSGSKHVSDTGSVRTLVFQIPDSSKKFSFSDSKLSQIQALYRQACYCANSGRSVWVTNGTIKGERLSAVSWIIVVDVTINYFGKTVHLKYKEPFYEKSLLQ